MRFPATAAKVQEARLHLDAMQRVGHGVNFRTSYNAFTGACKAAVHTLEAEGKRAFRAQGDNAGTRRFADWIREQRTLMNNDGVMRSVLKARDADIHEGQPAVQSTALYIEHMELNRASGPTGTTGLVLTFDGPQYVVDGDTSAERLEPVQHGQQTVGVVLLNPPTDHRGHPLEEEQQNPVAVARLALTYLEDLVRQAREKFAPA